ncbi:hypothetical protein [Nitrosospira sp. Nsp11]|uniref:hypothetical protein n=1 Tax=Nitrosospira sp. Nsp11 TaxID=1855338 RepID=UPI0015B38B5C|nr:hypothetical protein [Nitrosospira sp. Nsp11]
MGKGKYVTPPLPARLHDAVVAGHICDPAAACGLTVLSSSITLGRRQALTWLL